MRGVDERRRRREGRRRRGGEGGRRRERAAGAARERGEHAIVPVQEAPVREEGSGAERGRRRWRRERCGCGEVIQPTGWP
ncbi:hypothetical protein BDA96_03G025100 [Sorghum bicolor]|uniref:Uncharacterized protein n=1 Tax=Sorghum bicolor TaxID=4558 RepID=A0A921RA62_SORBI|nr:hypothetical protein BDA96_03G025100 [Sorghum bicolor]